MLLNEVGEVLGGIVVLLEELEEAGGLFFLDFALGEFEGVLAALLVVDGDSVGDVLGEAGRALRREEDKSEDFEELEAVLGEYLERLV